VNCNGFHAIVDGWTMAKSSMEECYNIISWLEDKINKDIDPDTIKKIRTLRNSRQIGILRLNGEICWHDWWTIDWLPIDFCRMLSKGTSFRYRNRNANPSRDDTILYTELAKRIGKSLNFVMNYSKNRAWNDKMLLRELKKVNNMVLRKEDRGNRWILCPLEWEDKQFEEFSSKYLKEDEPLPDLKHCRIYFLPKTHKENTPGRPIQTWPKGSQRYAKRVNKEIFEKLDEMGIVSRSTYDATQKVGGFIPDSNFVAADVDSMFPSIPRDELLAVVKQRLSKWSYKTIRYHLYCNQIIFRNKCFREMQGVAMGSRLSPGLAQLYLSHKLSLSQLNTNTIIALYVDDIGIRFKSRIRNTTTAALNMVDSINDAISPLKVSLLSEHAYMDITWRMPHGRSKFSQTTFTMFNDRERVFPIDWQSNLPGSVIHNAIVNEVDRLDKCERKTQGVEQPWPRPWSKHNSKLVFRIADSGGSTRLHKHMPLLLHKDPIERCRACCVVRKWEKKVKQVEIKQEEEKQVELVKIPCKITWCPLIETAVGRRVLRQALKYYAANQIPPVQPKQITIRWQYNGLQKALATLMIKDHWYHFKTTDEKPWQVSKQVRLA